MTDWLVLIVCAVAIWAMPVYAIIAEYQAANIMREAYEKQAAEQVRQFESARLKWENKS